ncbi:hairy-related 8a isoform X1 [Lepisosteus oculatus]|uniref:hairy-related 8a isoform X1 n=2 Tax=Lepisosteus oculatus TaxID=7918 RepID=UPI003715CA4B
MTASNVETSSDRNYSAKEERKLRKPLIEKRRRERINSSLEQLKGIMVDAYNLDQSKLEKADVLEITVQHMEGLQRRQASGGGKPGFESRQRYSSGYIQCMHEVHNLLLSCPGMDKNVGARLLNHLLKSLPRITGEAGSPAACGGGAHHAPILAPSSPVYEPRPAHLPSPSPLAHAPGAQRQHHHLNPSRLPSPTTASQPEAPEGSGGGGETAPSSPGSPLPSPHRPLPLPGSDPSMWRPW